MNTTCAKCKLTRIEGQPDPCLGMLPGVSFACCGHGGEGYIRFDNGKTIRFNNAEIDHVTHEPIDIDPNMTYEVDDNGEPILSSAIPISAALAYGRELLRTGHDIASVKPFAF